jgi:hypothetical protein
VAPYFFRIFTNFLHHLISYFSMPYVKEALAGLLSCLVFFCDLLENKYYLHHIKKSKRALVIYTALKAGLWSHGHNGWTNMMSITQ